MSEVIPAEGSQYSESPVELTEVEAPSDNKLDVRLLICAVGMTSLIVSGAVMVGSSIDGPQNSLQDAEAYSLSEAQPQPIGTPPPTPEGTGGYRYMETQPNDPSQAVRWDPCQPIHYVINPTDAPKGGLKAIESAVTAISKNTGLKFAYDGTTNEEVKKSRPVMDTDRYGERYSPVLVDFVTPEEYPDMNGKAGLGGPDTVALPSGYRKHVSGVVILNKDYFNEISTWNDGDVYANGVAVHEFGHLVGLDHVDDSSQVMYRKPATNQLQAGDLRGLAKMGSGECFS